MSNKKLREVGQANPPTLKLLEVTTFSEEKTRHYERVASFHLTEGFLVLYYADGSVQAVRSSALDGIVANPTNYEP